MQGCSKHQRGLVIDVDGSTPRKRRARSSFLARTGVKRQRWYIRERRIVITEAGLKTRGSIRPCEARSSISIVVSGSRRCLPLSTPAISFYWYRLREKFIGSAQRPDRSSIPTKIEEKPRRSFVVAPSPRSCNFRSYPATIRGLLRSFR